MFKHSVLNYGSQLGEVRKVIKFSKEDIGLQNLWPRIDVVMLLSSLPQDEYYIAYGSVNSKRVHPPGHLSDNYHYFFGGGGGISCKCPSVGPGSSYKKTKIAFSNKISCNCHIYRKSVKI